MQKYATYMLSTSLQYTNICTAANMHIYTIYMPNVCNKYAYNFRTECQEMHLCAFICQLYTEISLPYMLYTNNMQIWAGRNLQLCML